MKPKRLVGVSIIMVLAGIVAVFFSHMRSGPPEPIYQGRTLTEWLKEYEYPGVPGSAGYEARMEASAAAVSAMGTNAIPTLLHLFHAKDSTFKALTIALGQAFQNEHSIFAETKHRMAYLGFKLLGTNGLSAAPALVELMKSGDERVRLFALECLKGSGDWQVLLSALMEMFQRDPASSLRREAASEIVMLFPEEAEKAGVYAIFPKLRALDLRDKPDPNLHALLNPADPHRGEEGVQTTNSLPLTNAPFRP